MLGKKRGLLSLFLIIVAVLFAHDGVLAEEIGMTPDGNVIYEFKCPTTGVRLKVEQSQLVGVCWRFGSRVIELQGA